MKLEIDTEAILIRSILDTTHGVEDMPPMVQTTIRNLILATARNDLIVVECKHDSGHSAYVLCVHVTDNPVIGDRLLPLCVIPQGNEWIASMCPPSPVPKSAFVTPIPPPDDAPAMIQAETLEDARNIVRELQEQGEDEELRELDEDEEENTDAHGIHSKRVIN